ncbi:hypothetical protein AB0C34_28400 [Nocardia sp. NPDC049220]|uniref:hypothetical protein n=1 Tax=Nocardia sp. NPDC049220 TaxID=3155273 RepID=UPI00340096F6
MTDRSVEDELIAEARKFGHSLTHLLRLYAQAGTWLERRRVRKQISVVLREQRREEQTARGHQLVFTQQMIDRYRVHALAISERAENPSVDHERRYRDAQSLSRHANDLRARIVANDRLTKTEQGIALDGLDAATMFPRFEPGRLFDQAHKVRGIDALRYRAQVARTVREQLAHTPQREQRQAPRFETSLTWSTRDGEIAGREIRGFDQATDGLAWAYRDIDHSLWSDDQQVEVSVRDQGGRRVYQRHGHPQEVAEQLEHPLGIIRDADGAFVQKPGAGVFADPDTLADHQRTVAEAHFEWSRPTVDRPPQGTDSVSKPFVVNVGPADVIHMGEHEFARIPGEDHPQLRTFETREQAYDWALNQLDAYRETSSRRGEDFTASIREHGRRDNSEVVDGPLGMVTDEIRSLREEHIRHSAERPQTRSAEPKTQPPVEESQPSRDRLAEVERQLKDISDDRDRLGSRVEMLQRGLDAVSADRDEHRRKLEATQAQVESLQNTNLRQTRELEDLRQNALRVVKLTVERDQYKSERDQFKAQRDEAVQKLAQATPAHERYGNREHSNGKSTDPQPTSENGRQSSTGPMGKRASYLHLTGKGRDQAGPDTQSWPHPERDTQGRNGIERSR